MIDHTKYSIFDLRRTHANKKFNLNASSDQRLQSKDFLKESVKYFTSLYLRAEVKS